MIERSPFSHRPVCRSGPANEYGAAAPAAPSAAAPAAAFLTSSRLVRRRSSNPEPPFPPSIAPPFRLAECPSGEPGDEPVQKRVVDERQRDARDQDRGHDPGPVE